MKRIIISMLLIMMFSTAVNAQINDLPDELLLKPELKSNFVGKWIANHEDMTYEMTLTTVFNDVDFRPIGIDKSIKVEEMIGNIIYKKGGVIIRATQLDNMNSFLVAADKPNSHFIIGNVFFMRLIDKERDVNGEVKLLISDDKKSVSWELDYLHMYLLRTFLPEEQENYKKNRTRTFDIPKELIFYKVADPTPPTEPILPQEPTPPVDPPKGPIKKPAGPGDTNPGNPIVVTSTIPESK